MQLSSKAKIELFWQPKNGYIFNTDGVVNEMKNIITLAIISLNLLGCTKKVPCVDSDIKMAFIGFTESDLDTIVLRKFQPDDNYQHLIDTINIFYDSSLYFRSNDTMFVSVYDPIRGIKAYSDWQIFIPGTTKTVLISAIVTEQMTTKCSTLGETLNCDCLNKIYSLKRDNIFMDLSNLNPYINPYRVYINR